MKNRFTRLFGICATFSACALPVTSCGSPERSCAETLTCRGSGAGVTSTTMAGEGGESPSGGASGRGSGGNSGSGDSVGGSAGTAGRGSGGAGAAPSSGGASGDAGEAGHAEGGAGGSGPDCGNGRVDEGEECDDSDDNGPGMACNDQCRLNVCGDGDQGPTEACDDGDDNALELLACAPDCSRIVQAKHIVISPPPSRSGRDLGINPVATADSDCPPGYKAMFAYSTVRRATTRPFESLNAVDWVIQPYTIYLNAYENLVWATRAVPLLGVENGEFVGLENAIAGVIDCFVSNMNIDGTTLTSDNCNGWSTNNSGYATCGVPYATTESYLVFADGPDDCDGYTNFYCVEQ